ncbi:MAG: hypothetical protein V2A77_10015 [Pseudomonadota bacterium]
MNLSEKATTIVRWAYRVAWLLVLSYIIFCMLLFGGISLGTGLEEYGRQYRVVYLTGGVLGLLGGAAVAILTVRWVAGLIRQKTRPSREPDAAGEPKPTA